jgi:serum/glucocorticoid-regulated kinase 2
VPHFEFAKCQLLNREPEKRLGNAGAQEIKSHPFFASIDWKKLLAKRIQPPFKPSVVLDLIERSLTTQDSAIDTSNFDQEFTSEAPTDSVVDDSQLSETVQLQFQGWSYKGGSANGVRASINDGPSSIIG